MAKTFDELVEQYTQDGASRYEAELAARATLERSVVDAAMDSDTPATDTLMGEGPLAEPLPQEDVSAPSPSDAFIFDPVEHERMKQEAYEAVYEDMDRRWGVTRSEQEKRDAASQAVEEALTIGGDIAPVYEAALVLEGTPSDSPLDVAIRVLGRKNLRGPIPKGITAREESKQRRRESEAAIRQAAGEGMLAQARETAARLAPSAWLAGQEGVEVTEDASGLGRLAQRVAETGAHLMTGDRVYKPGEIPTGEAVDPFKEIAAIWEGGGEDWQRAAGEFREAIAPVPASELPGGFAGTQFVTSLIGEVSPYAMAPIVASADPERAGQRGMIPRFLRDAAWLVYGETFVGDIENLMGMVATLDPEKRARDKKRMQATDTSSEFAEASRAATAAAAQGESPQDIYDTYFKHMRWSQLPRDVAGERPEGLEDHRLGELDEMPIETDYSPERLLERAKRYVEAEEKTSGPAKEAIGRFLEGATTKDVWTDAGLRRRQSHLGWLMNVPGSAATEVILEGDIPIGKAMYLPPAWGALGMLGLMSGDIATLQQTLDDLRVPTRRGIEHMMLSESPVLTVARERFGIEGYDPLYPADSTYPARIGAQLQNMEGGVLGGYLDWRSGLKLREDSQAADMLEYGGTGDKALRTVALLLDFFFPWEEAALAGPVGAAMKAKTGVEAGRLAAKARPSAVGKARGFGQGFVAGSLPWVYSNLRKNAAGSAWQRLGLTDTDAYTAVYDATYATSMAGAEKGENMLGTLSPAWREQVDDVMRAAGMPVDWEAKSTEATKAQQRRHVESLVEVLMGGTPEMTELRASDSYQRLAKELDKEVAAGKLDAADRALMLAFYEVSAQGAVESGKVASEADFFDRLRLVSRRDRPTAEQLEAEHEARKAVRVGVGEMAPQADEPRNLIVQHNLGANQLVAADELGGLAVPSLAISRIEHPIDKYGEVTLIADPSLADPGRGVPVFDADVYSPTHPRQRWKPKKRAVEKWEKENLPWEWRRQFGGMLDGDLEEAVAGGRDSTEFRRFADAAPMQAKYLRDVHGIGVEPVYEHQLYGRMADFARSPSLQESLADINPKDWYESATGGPEQVAMQERLGEAMRAEMDLQLREMAERRAQKRGTSTEEEYAFLSGRGRGEWMFDDQGRMNWAQADSLISNLSALRRDPVLDATETRRATQKAVDSAPGGREAYEKWVDEQIQPLRGDSVFVPEGQRRAKPYTLDNVVAAMTRKIQHAGDTFMSGLGGLRARGAKRFKSMEQVKAGRERIVPQEEFEAARDRVQERFFKVAERLEPLYRGHNRFGMYDEVVEAIAESFKRGRSLRSELRYGFGSNIPADILRDLAEVGEDLRTMVTGYFEAKPQRAVGIEEFRAAVVPKNIDPQARSVLERRGLDIVEYDPEVEGDRARAIRQASEEQGVLFQAGRRAPTFYSAVDRGVANVFGDAESMKAQSLLAKLRQQPNVKAEELAWMGLDDWLESKGSERVTYDEIKALVDAERLDTRIQEVTYGDQSPEVQAAGQAHERAQADARTAHSAFLATVNHLAETRGQQPGTGPGRFAPMVKIDNDTRLLTQHMLVQKRGEGGEFKTLDYDQHQAFVDSVTDPELRAVFDASGEARAANARQHEAARDLERLRTATGGRPTSYQDYTYPGGKPDTYREMLFTLPRSKTVSEVAQEMFGIGLAQLTPEQQRAVDVAWEKQGAARNFESSHWREPNVLAHVRFDEATGPNGEKVLRVHEVQSDWHQKGRDEGYAKTAAESRAEIEPLIVEYEAAQQQLSDAEVEAGVGTDAFAKIVEQRPETLERWRDSAARAKRARDAAFSYLHQRGYRPEEVGQEGLVSIAPGAPPKPLRDVMERTAGQVDDSRVPPAPFKDTWHQLVMKRMVRHAADNGFDVIAWPKGVDEAELFGLGGRVDEVRWEFDNADDPSDGRLVVMRGDEPIDASGVDEATWDNLEDYIGAEPAARLREAAESTAKDAGVGYVRDARTGEAVRQMTDADLQREQSGTVEFTEDGRRLYYATTGGGYGDYVAAISGGDLKAGTKGMEAFYDEKLVNWAKKFAKKMKARVGEAGLSRGEGKRTQTWHYMTVSDKMKRVAVEEGQPLFQPGARVRGSFHVEYAPRPGEGPAFYEVWDKETEQVHGRYRSEDLPEVEAMLAEDETLTAYPVDAEGNRLGDADVPEIIPQGVVSIFADGRFDTHAHEGGHLLERLMGDAWLPTLGRHFDTEPSGRLTRTGKEQVANGMQRYMETLRAPTGSLTRFYAEARMRMADMWFRYRHHLPDDLRFRIDSATLYRRPKWDVVDADGNVTRSFGTEQAATKFAADRDGFTVRNMSEDVGMPREVAMLWDTFLRPKLVADAYATTVRRGVAKKRQLGIDVPNDPVVMAQEGPVRRAGTAREAARVDSTPEAVRQALNVKPGDEVGLLDMVARSVAYVATENFRKSFTGQKLVRMTTRTIVPAGRVERLRREANNALTQALGTTPDQFVKGGVLVGGDAVRLTPAQQNGIRDLANRLAREPMGTMAVPRDFLDPSSDLSVVPIAAINRMQEVFIDTRAGVGARRSRAAEAVPTSVGYALVRALGRSPERIHEVAIGARKPNEIASSLRKAFVVERPAGEYVDPGVLDIMERAGRKMGEAQLELLRHSSQYADDAAGGSRVRRAWRGFKGRGPSLLETLQSFRRTLNPPVDLSLLGVEPPKRRVLDDGRVEVQPYRVNPHTRTSLLYWLDRFDDVENPVRLEEVLNNEALEFFGSMLDDGYGAADVERQALQHLRSLDLADVLDALHDPNKVDFIEGVMASLGMVERGMRTKWVTVQETAHDLGIALSGSPESNVWLGTDPDRHRETYAYLYDAFYSGRWEEMARWAAQRGLATGFETEAGRVANIDVATILVEMVTRLRAREILAEVGEELRAYGLTLDQDAIAETAGLPADPEQRDRFMNDVLHYINNEVSWKQYRQTDEHGHLWMPPQPDGGFNAAAYDMAQRLLVQMGFRYGKGEWVRTRLPDGSDMLLPQMLKDNLDDYLKRAADVGHAWGTPQVGSAPVVGGIVQKVRGTERGLGATVAGEGRTGAGVRLDGGAPAGGRETMGRLAGETLDLLIEAFPFTPSKIRQGVTTGLGIPNPAYFTAAFVGGFLHAYAATGVKGLSAGTRHAGTVSAIMRRMHGKSNVPSSGRIFTTRDGRIYTVDMLAKQFREGGLHTSFIHAETARSMAEDLGNQHAHGLRKLATGFFKWQDVLRETATAVDNFHRIGVALDELAAGKSMDEATAVARDALLDYGKLTDTEKLYGRAGMLFYSYMRRANDQFWDTLLTNPSRVLGQLRLLRGLQRLHVEEDDPELFIGAFDEQRFPIGTRSALEEMGLTGALRRTAQYRDVMYLAPPLPVPDIGMLYVDLWASMLEGDEGAQRAIASQLAPWVQYPMVMATDTEPFSGRDISSMNMVPPGMVEFDRMTTGGILVDGMLGVRMAPNGAYGARYPITGSNRHYEATNAELWWAMKNMGAGIPGMGRQIDVFAAMDRANLRWSPPEAAVRLARKAQPIADDIGWYNMLNRATSGRYQSAMERAESPRFMPQGLASPSGPRLGMTEFDEAMGVLGLPPRLLRTEKAAWEQLQQEAQRQLMETTQEAEATEPR